jgi:hypothetical protein
MMQTDWAAAASEPLVQGCSTQSSAAGLNSTPCESHEGTGVSKPIAKFEASRGPACIESCCLFLVPIIGSASLHHAVQSHRFTLIEF